MREKACGACAYFRQHYTFDKQRIFRVYCGHCTFSRPKRKLPDSTVCENFSPVDPGEYPFATKEYLSKELLQYFLRLELLPEIKDLEETGR